GSAQTMSSPLRRKKSWGATRMVSSRSPAARSARGVLPPRSTRRVAPFSIPGGEAGAAAGRARVGDEAPGAAAARARPLDGDGEDALLEADAAAAAAHRA